MSRTTSKIESHSSPGAADYSISSLCLPAIVSNIAVPLLGLSDTAISGHLGSDSFIGAIAVGSMMLNCIYWLFGFLRMGTTGMVARAFGSGNGPFINLVFCRAALIALAGAVIILLLRPLLMPLLMWYISAPADVARPASVYFSICIWGAPAILLTNVVSGWFLGMQDTVRPMTVSISTAILNVVLSIIFVFPLKVGFVGIAWGTLLSSWIGLLLAVMLMWRFNGRKWPIARPAELISPDGIGSFFRINSDIFLRTICIMLVSVSVTSFGARLGSLTLATNAIMMQFFVMFSYFMDGIAFAAEALAGRFSGAGEAALFRQAVRRLLGWSGCVAAIFTLVYIFGYRQIVALLTSDAAVVAEVCKYNIWLILLPVITVAAFIMDGIYIGLTATRSMLVVTLLSALVFFAVCFLPGGFAFPDNNLLWTAFLSYLLSRGLLLAVRLPQVAPK